MLEALHQAKAWCVEDNKMLWEHWWNKAHKTRISTASEHTFQTTRGETRCFKGTARWNCLHVPHWQYQVGIRRGQRGVRENCGISRNNRTREVRINSSREGNRPEWWWAFLSREQSITRDDLIVRTNTNTIKTGAPVVLRSRSHEELKATAWSDETIYTVKMKLPKITLPQFSGKVTKFVCSRIVSRA